MAFTRAETPFGVFRQLQDQPGAAFAPFDVQLGLQRGLGLPGATEGTTGSPSSGGRSGGGGASIEEILAAQIAAQNTSQQQTQQREQQQQEATRQAEEAQRRGTFNTSVSNEEAAARQRAVTGLQNSGFNLDFNRVNPLIENELSRIRSGIPDLATNVGSFFGGNDISQIVLDQLRTQDRNRATSALNQFAAPGFASNLIADTADDEILNTILGEQFGGAQSNLERAFKRGNLGETAFGTAQDLLGRQNTAGLSRLQGIGGNVLESNREALRGIANQGFNRAGSLQPGDVFNPADIQGQITSLLGERTGRLEGDIRNAIGGENFFDPQSILQEAGVRQGATNLTAGNDPSLAAFFDAQQRQKEQTRGLGSRGAF
jgi:hypothetical protein